MNILDYLATEFATFDEKPVNPVDSAILSQVCMVRMESIAPTLREEMLLPDNQGGSMLGRLRRPARGIRFADALRAEHYDRMFTGLVPGLVKENLLAVAASPRFRDVRVRDCVSVFDEERQVQFAAMTFIYKKAFAYVGFRGTDTSFAAWRENFNMAYLTPVPAQELAVRYLEAVAPHLPNRLLVGGHSKGGNLAEYAALRAKPAVQERIARVFDHDGPGFKAGAIGNDEFSLIRDRVHKTVPQESFVGMLMEAPEGLALHVVRSTEHGMQQHSPFTWEVAGDDFAYADSLSDAALSVHAVVSRWLAGLSPEETKQVVEAAFTAIGTSSALDASDILQGGTRSITLLIEAAKNLDPASRDILVNALGSLADLIARDAARSVADRLTPKAKA